MTMMVVALLNGKTKAEWYDWMAERVKNNVGYTTPEALPQPFANRGQQQGSGPQQQRGGPLSGPAQFLTNAINNGSLRFDRGNDDDDMDADDQDQYNKSPTQMDDDAMIEDTSSSSSSKVHTSNATSSSASSVPIDSSAAPEKLSPGIEKPEHMISPPSAVMGVKSSPSSQTSNIPNAGEDDKSAHPAVQADGYMDSSENPLKG